MSDKKTVKSKIKSVIKSVNGTAGEAFENSTFDSMVNKYGENTTYKVLESELKKAGETIESFKIYQRVKRKVQNDQISIYRTEQKLEEEVKKVVKGELGYLLKV
ncbi:hypothetical protein I6F48_00220 [Pseudoalteromonas sp. SWYJ118]|uniref:hypothetical protein n=1 Tax=Pseudoalteromonas sp. SWYJ118 TaxID=2792062 RepID=UPI0018CDF3D1|nr:hypothetical protein [Pseudoalteromonas sp. SWYJ118]MBH0073988.1 hypothetical protein [Pseudoalteromonas sp. SWYJ118]